MLYATDEVQGVGGLFGSLSTETGAFSPIGAVGCGEGALGTRCFDDIDGLSFDPTSGVLYGSVRLKGEGVKDVLIQIDPATGEVLTAVAVRADGELVRDIEGLTFDTDGRLLGVQGGMFRTVYVIDPATGATTVLANITQASDFEAIDCIIEMVPPPPPGDCDCEGGVKELTMRFDGDAAATVTVYNDKNADPDKVLFSGLVSPGEEFAIRSSTLDERKFKSNISFYIDGAKDTELHTSCSRPIGSGQAVGEFTVVSGIDRMDNVLCPFDPEGADAGNDASRTDTGIPTEFEVGQAYPNPFSRQTMIGVDLPEAAIVQVVVYDVQGRQVAVLLDEERAAGRHRVAFDADGLAPGMYSTG